jgi:hypothetical protein
MGKEMADSDSNGCQADNRRQPVRVGNRDDSAHATGRQEQRSGPAGFGEVRNPEGARLEGMGGYEEQPGPSDGDWWSVEPDVGRVATRLANGMDVLGRNE